MHSRLKTKDLDPGDRLTVALGQYDTGWHDPVKSLARARTIAQQARAAGADLLVLPEMCASGFTMDVENFAEPPDGPSVRGLSALAADHHLWLIAGLSIFRNGEYVNSALAFAPDGSLVATYDKQRLFEYAGETGVYSAGTSSCVIQVAGLTVALFVCFDLRFPELFRGVGPEVDACVIIANWPSARQRHWEVLTQARAIENQCYVVAVNRIGDGDGLKYTGGSMILNPMGERCDRPARDSSLGIGEVLRSTVASVREAFPLADGRAKTEKEVATPTGIEQAPTGLAPRLPQSIDFTEGTRRSRPVA
jgi:omega-amidase